MKALLLAASLCAAHLFAMTPAAADTLAYPSSDEARFLLDYPADWEMVPGENEGDYVTLNAPTGAVLQLRTIPGTDSAVDEAVEASAEYLNETFSKVKLGEPQEIEEGGLSASLIRGTGIDGDRQQVAFAMYFIALPDGNIAEIWYAVVKGDTEGGAGAVKILNSFRTP